MMNSLIRYELEMANREQEQLRSRAALWDLARRTQTGRASWPQPRWLVAVLVFLLTRSALVVR